MFEISWSELLILVFVVLVFVKPKDLPYFFNSLGRFFGDIKRQANEFRRQFEDAMREAEMENIRKQLGDVDGTVQKAIEEIGTLADQDLGEARKADDSLLEPSSNRKATISNRQISSFDETQLGSQGRPSDEEKI